MAVTRINNNQITDASAGNAYLGINAGTKLQNYSITAGKIANNLTYGSDLTVSGNLVVNGTSTSIDTTITTIEDPVIVLASTQTGTPAVDIGFLGERGDETNIAFVWDESSAEFVTAFTSTSETSTTISISSYANFHTFDANIAGNLAVGGNIDITGNISSLNVTGNISGGNLLTPGLVSATGTITSDANISGANVLTGGLVSATGTITGGNLATGGTVSATGNVTGGNVLTGGLISATGTITSATTITGGNVDTGGTVSATGNVTGGNVLTGGLISSTGNITGGNIDTSGAVNATATITGGNLATGGTISGTGTITGGNVDTAGTVSAGGNITGANILTGGLVSATGTITSAANITGGNILTGGEVSATGNITGGNVNTAQVTGASALTLVAASGNINLEPTGNVVVNNTYINGLQLTPVQDSDAASKYYVDTIATTGLTFHEAVAATTDTTLATATGGTISYTQPNGAGNGVAAYIQTTGAFTTIDTANIQTVGTRILVKNEANAVLNGVYTYSNSTAIVRSVDTDQYGADSTESFSINDYFFTTGGNVNNGAAFVVDAPPGVITFGTSNITFAQFSSSQTYTANTAAGLTLINQQFNAKVDNDTTAFDGTGNIIVKAGANLVTPNIGAATGTSLSVTGTVTAASTVGGVITGSSASTTGNVTGGNVLTGGEVSATGNITGGNITTTNLSLTGNVLTDLNVTGNVNAGNLNAVTGVTAITGYFTGNVDVLGNLNATIGVVYANSGIFYGNAVTGNNAAFAGIPGFTPLGSNVVMQFAGNVNSYSQLNFQNINSGNIASTDFIATADNGDDSNYYLDLGINSSTFDDPADYPGYGANDSYVHNHGGNLILNPETAGKAINFMVGGTDTTDIIATMTNTQLSVSGIVSATGNITGANVSTAGALQGGNIVISGDDITDTNGRVNFNTAGADVDFAVNADTVANAFYVDAGTGTASFGSATQTVNAIVAFNSTNSILAPVGNTGQRPAVGVTGMVRFNTSDNNLELFDNSAWTAVGVPVFTVISDEQFNGDGSTVAFTLSSTQTTNSCIVSINGVVQIPTSAYSVAGTDPSCVLTFTEAPEAGDLIDVREITTTTTVTSISNSSGNAVVAVSPTANDVNITGDVIPTGNGTQALGSNTNRFSNIWLTGSTITLGNTVIKNTSGNTIGFFGPDGSTPATIDAASVDTTTIANGTSNVKIATANSNVSINVAGSGVVTFGTGGITNDLGNGVGNIGSASGYFNTVFAQATSAQYADLAEKYVADAEYAPGTVVVFGGTHEVTVNATDADRKVAGVVSTNPSYIMNGGLEAEHVATVALTGRVPTMVVGTVRKGDLMVAAGLGRARSEADPKVGTVIGKALEDFDGAEGTIEVVVGRF